VKKYSTSDSEKRLPAWYVPVPVGGGHNQLGIILYHRTTEGHNMLPEAFLRTKSRVKDTIRAVQLIGKYQRRNKSISDHGEPEGTKGSSDFQ
jgi:hypothetical protein